MQQPGVYRDSGQELRPRGHSLAVLKALLPSDDPQWAEVRQHSDLRGG